MSFEGATKVSQCRSYPRRAIRLAAAVAACAVFPSHDQRTTHRHMPHRYVASVDTRSWAIGFALSAATDTVGTGLPFQTVLWHLKSGRAVARLGPGNRPLAFNASASLAACAEWNDAISLWNTETGSRVRNLLGHHTVVQAASFSADGRLLVSAAGSPGTPGGELCLWDVPSGRLLWKKRETGSAVLSVALTPDSQITAAGSMGYVRLWATKSGRWLRTLRCPRGEVNALAFSPDGRFLSGGSAAGKVTLWSVRKGRLAQFSHGDIVHSVAFSRDGSALASGGADGTVRIWNLTTKRAQQILATAGSPAIALTFVPDGLTLRAGCLDNSVRSWNWRTGEYLGAVSTPQAP